MCDEVTWCAKCKAKKFKCDSEMCDNCNPDSLWNKAKLMVGCLEECRAFAIQMEWLSESGEIEEDAPGWVSLLVHSIPEGIPSR